MMVSDISDHAVTDDLQHKIGLQCKSWQLCAFSTRLAMCDSPVDNKEAVYSGATPEQQWW